MALDLDCELGSQGPFAAVLHKLSSLLVEADRGDRLAAARCARVEQFLADHSRFAM